MFRARAQAGSKIFVGVDITDVEQLAARLAGQPALAEEIFSARELAYVAGRKRRAEHLAARFAAKEAVFKALGAGMRWRDVEVVNSASGKPRLHLSGVAAAAAARHRIGDMDISLSHNGGMAIAFVVLTAADADSTELDTAAAAEEVTA
ncbi:holo-ACP synthase [Nocardia sp. NPDC057663]|uniref:holo-ACP synthase n=1 Tax=Nocardia sp. NPDC057663 TaxID=3346201 RepID=UPI0036733B15